MVAKVLRHYAIHAGGTSEWWHTMLWAIIKEDRVGQGPYHNNTAWFVTLYASQHMVNSGLYLLVTLHTHSIWYTHAHHWYTCTTGVATRLGSTLVFIYTMDVDSVSCKPMYTCEYLCIPMTSVDSARVYLCFTYVYPCTYIYSINIILTVVFSY